MKTKTETKLSLAHLSFLPSFAQYLLQHRLNDFVAALIHFLDEVDIPLMKYFKQLSYEELFAISKISTEEMLSYLAENKASEQIAVTLSQWTENQLPIIKKEDIVAEDITMAIYLRKKTLLHFIQDYCTETDKILELIREIDLYLAISETALTNTYINILKNKIHDDNLIIEKVNQTIPGAVYVFDVINFKGIYSNNKLDEIIGYNHEELNALGPGAISQLLHPKDQDVLKLHIQEVCKADDGEVKICKYRIRNKEGNYRWISNFESVFKRDGAGKVIQSIGITLDVDKEQQIAEALLENKKMSEQAEELTHLGRYTWNLLTNILQWSDELYRIYGIDPLTHIDYPFIQQFYHPDDIDTVEEAIEKAIINKDAFEFYYRITNKNGVLKILHARGNIIENEEGVAHIVLGTVQDETEKQTMIRQLKQSESVYKQAEELANMGNWSWNVVEDKIEWTDQLYRIYGMQPGQENMTIERFFSFVHPDDRLQVRTGTELIATQDLLDYTFRIITKTGQIKIIQSVARVQRNDMGAAVMVIGTERDITERQTLIEQLQESEKLSLQAQALAHLGNWTLDVEKNLLKWSNEMYNIFELERDKPMYFENWLHFLHPDEREEIIQYHETCKIEKEQYDKIHRIYLLNGKIKTIHSKGEFIYDEIGHALQMIGTSQDITAADQVQQELKENQMFISKIADATPSIIASYNINTGKYVFISEGLEKLLGYHRDEVMNEGVAFFIAIIHPDDVPGMLEKNTNALKEANNSKDNNDIVVDYTYRMRHRNGSFRWFHTYGTIFDRNSDGKVEHVLNISLDITEQVQSAEKIKDQEHFIQQIADASPTILYLYDVPSRSFQYINREIFFVLGYLPEELIQAGNKITEMLYHPEDVPLLPSRKQDDHNHTTSDAMIQYECRMKNKDGEWKWLLIREVIFKTNENGNILQMLGTALDINRRKELEKTIVQNTLMLEQSNQSLEEFAYVASHDLKEPLRKISTFGDRLLATHFNNMAPEGKVYMQKIVEASNRMQVMINDLLSISMISGNTSFEKCSLQDILEEVLQTLEFKIEQQHAVIRSDRLPDAEIIPSQFRHLFQNLLSNSLKFVNPEVQPVITIRHSIINAPDLTTFHLNHGELYHNIAFADNGIGFDMEYSGKIFAIFQRLHGRSEYEGSGIGLAICKKIVEHHKGIIYASSKPGEGATFTIMIPA